LAFELDAFTRMAAINLYKINTAGHLIGISRELLGKYPRRTIAPLIVSAQIIFRKDRLNDCFNCPDFCESPLENALDNCGYPAPDLTNGPLAEVRPRTSLVKALIFKACE
jgi:hypothetical protein